MQTMKGSINSHLRPVIFHRVLPWESGRVKIFIDETPMAAYNGIADKAMPYPCETE